jgi:hypothetical protein
MVIDWERTHLRITFTGRSGWQHGRLGWRSSVPSHDLWYVIGGTRVGCGVPLRSGRSSRHFHPALSPLCDLPHDRASGFSPSNNFFVALYSGGMNKTEQRIVETLAHAKDAAVVLDHIELKPESPAEAGAHAEIKVAEASLATAINTLESLKTQAATPGADEETAVPPVLSPAKPA